MKIKTFVVGPIETNCYVVYDGDSREGIIIDPGHFDRRISEFIKDERLKVKYIVNTHGHYDHIGADKEFGYPVLIHEQDKSCFNDPMRNLSIISGTVLPCDVEAETLKDGDRITFGKTELKVIHTPGHSAGGITLDGGKVLFTGDTLFFEGVGRTDLPFSNTVKLKDSVRKLMQKDDNTIFYPGHGPSSTIGHEKKNNPFI